MISNDLKSRKDTQLDQHLFVFILSLTTPMVLYFNRHFDNNRLTSWNWVFNFVELFHVGLILTMALVLAWLLSLVTFYEKRKGSVLFIGAFIMAALFWSEPEVIVDSSRYFTQAKQLSVYGVGYFAEQWGKAIFAWTDLPLVSFLYGLVFKYIGEQRIFIQVLNTFFFAATVVLTYQLGKTLWNEDTGFLGGLLLLGFPYLYSQIPLLLVDVPTMFFFMLAVVTTIGALQKGGKARIILASLALFLVFYVKYSTWILMTLFPVIYIYCLWTDPSRVLRRGLVLALLALVMIVLVFLKYKSIMIPQLNFLVEYQKPGLTRWSESYTSTFLFQIHPFITIAALAAIFAAIKKVDFRFVIISFLLLLFLFMQVKRIRYTMPVFPMLALMAAYGLGVLQNKTLIKQVVFSIVASSFVVAYMGYLPFLKTLGVANLQEAGHYINDIAANDVEVVSLAGDNAVVNPATSIPILDIYTDKNLVSASEPVGREVLERVKTAPLRFTWEFPLPEYYFPAPGSKKTEALVIITNDSGQILEPEIESKISLYPLQKKFTATSNIFQHQTFVTVYHK